LFFFLFFVATGFFLVIFKFDTLLRYGSRGSKIVTSGQIQYGVGRANWAYLNRSTSAADCSISLKCGTRVHYGLRSRQRD